MGYSIDPISDGCYPDTSILVNKFDIRTQNKLDEVENVLVSARYAEWLNHPLKQTFDFEHYKAIHKHLFSDLYEWAGEVRTVDISKKGTKFCPSIEIEHRAGYIFQRLAQRNYFRELAHHEFVEEITDFYCVTNDLHPFREGNGRTQRVFLTQLISAAGYTILFENMDTDLLMIATIQAAQGITDQLYRILSEYIK